MLSGADADALDRLAARADQFSRQLHLTLVEIRGLLASSPWSGPDAEDFRQAWRTTHSSHLSTVESTLASAAQQLRLQATQQREASSAHTGAAAGPSHGGILAVGSHVGILDPRVAYGKSGTYSRFDASEHGVDAIVEAFWATGDGARADRDEIEIRQLDNGRYIVVLPGVTDLTDHLDDVARGFPTGDAADPWYDNDANTVRKMRYAISAANDPDFVDPYALVVAEQMQRAGIPVGADVMIIGHSYGAYAAMNLAANDSFNSADGDSAGYHVNVTHVLAAGADTDWQLAGVPPQTNALVLNNRNDPVVRAEDIGSRHGNTNAASVTHVERVFSGGWWDDGHKVETYVGALRSTAHDHADVRGFLESAGASYNGAGSRSSVKVPDPLIENLAL